MKLKDLIEKNDTSAGRVFDLFIQFLIILSLVSFCIETIPNLSPQYVHWLNILELFVVIIFTVEYILRLFVSDNKLKFIFSFHGLIDLFAILPFYLATQIDLRSVRIFRLLRLFRAFKLLRYSEAMGRLGKAFLMIKDELIIFLVSALFLLFISSVGIYYFENTAQPEKFSSMFECMWWAVSTLTTVGYGDMYPITVGGKVFTFFILIIGLGIIAVPAGLIASALTRSIDDEKKDAV